MKIKYLTTASLIKVLAGEVIDFKTAKNTKRGRKRAEEKDRKESNERILKELRKQGEFEEDDKAEYDQKKVWEKVPKKFQELGMIDVAAPDWVEKESVAQNFMDDVDEKSLSRDDAESLAEWYDKEHMFQDFKSFLMQAFDEGEVPPASGQPVHFLLYPEDAFGTATVGPSVNHLNPEDLYDPLEQALRDNYEFIVIYSDDEEKYRKLFKDLQKDQEAG